MHTSYIYIYIYTCQKTLLQVMAMEGGTCAAPAWDSWAGVGGGGGDDGDGDPPETDDQRRKRERKEAVPMML